MPDTFAFWLPTHKSNTTFKGNHIIIKVNDKTVVDYVDPKKTYLKGHMALQQHDPGTKVWFRKVEVIELPATKEPKAKAN